MSIEKQYILHCDHCSAAIGPFEGNSPKAIGLAKEAGWKVYYIAGGILAECPECQAKQQKEKAEKYEYKPTLGAIARKERIDAMIAMYQSGKTASEVAIEFGVSRQAVSSLLAKHGIIVRPQGKDEDKWETRECDGCGTEIRKRASYFRMQHARNTTNRIFCSSQCFAKNGTHSRFDVAEIVTLYNSGFTATKIAAVMNCSPALVYQRLRRAGIKMRTRQDYQSNK